MSEQEHDRQSGSADPRFVCDCMCCGASKCLRAWGYYAHWEYGITDEQVVGMAVRDDLIVVTCDSGIMARNVITSGRAKAIFIPVGLDRWAQFAAVLKEVPLPRCDPRCMSCGEELERIDKEQFREELPLRTYEWLDEFWRCKACEQFFWKGTHWQDIAGKLDEVEQEYEKGSGSRGL